MRHVWLVFVVAVALTLGSLGVASARESTTQNGTPKDTTTDTEPQTQSASKQAVTPKATTATKDTSTKNGFTLTKTVDPKRATVGRNLTFTVTEANNSGRDVVFDSGINDILPKGVKFVSATSSRGSCSYAGSTRTVNCNGFTLRDGKTDTITIVAQAQKSGRYTNTANDTGFPGNVVSVPFTVR